MLIATFVAAGCSSSAASDPVAHACALVAYWADTSGSVSDPDSGPTSVSEVTEIAKEGWPNDTGMAAQFVQLYDDLSSDLSDSQYAAEAAAFESANCQ
jgi:hypothetical protein